MDPAAQVVLIVFVSVIAVVLVSAGAISFVENRQIAARMAEQDKRAEANKAARRAARWEVVVRDIEARPDSAERHNGIEVWAVRAYFETDYSGDLRKAKTNSVRVAAVTVDQDGWPDIIDDAVSKAKRAVDKLNAVAGSEDDYGDLTPGDALMRDNGPGYLPPDIQGEFDHGVLGREGRTALGSDRVYQLERLLEQAWLSGYRAGHVRCMGRESIARLDAQDDRRDKLAALVSALRKTIEVERSGLPQTGSVAEWEEADHLLHDIVARFEKVVDEHT